MQPELNAGDTAVVNLDALSHSFNYFRVEIEILDRQHIGLEIADSEIVSFLDDDSVPGIDIAVFRILRWTEYDDETSQFLPDDPSLVGNIETMVRYTPNGAWHTTTPLILSVTFEQKENDDDSSRI